MRFPRTSFANNPSAFTLIEVIISLVVCSILATMIATYVGDSIGRSATPGSDLRDTLKIYSVMERIRLVYDNDPALTLATLKNDIGSAGANPHTNSFGTYNVIYNDYIQCDASTTTTFTADSGCNATIETCNLFISISDPDQSGIKVSNLFTE